jgi:hypothetical protein
MMNPLTSYFLLVPLMATNVRVVFARPPDVGSRAYDQLPDHVLTKWMSDSGIRRGVNLRDRLQEVDGDDNSVVFPSFGKISLDGLEPYSSFTDGAVCSSEGTESTNCVGNVPLTTFVATKKRGAGEGDDLRVLVAKDLTATSSMSRR